MKNKLTIAQALKWGRQKLISSSTSADLDTEVLLMFVLKKDRSFLFTHPEKILTPTQSKKLITLIRRRAQNWPVAYLTGEKNFYNLTFKVNQNVLVPRPDSELLVTEVISQIKSQAKNKNLILFDIGTGSGCLPIAINKNIVPLHLPTFATDISPVALIVAKKNSQLNKIKIKFFLGDLLTPLKKVMAKNLDSFFLITANLPYLTPKQLKEKSIQKEPHQALDGGREGLFFYRRFLKQIKQNRLKQGIVFLEIDPDQEKKIKLLIKKILPTTQVEFKKDLAKLTRLVMITI
ncbi:MAG TPA: peptide chain release factor N(5)-glutamine methyltransferase [Candidatus Magasanikbacteria bacterium]|nr:peptide chain release factor N(5)-glutamine methyltransferase [Candidatus Magasanikbacteria bacterium]